MTALINGDSVTLVDGITEPGGHPISLEQFAAQHLGYTVTVVSGSTWDSMSQSDFAKYSLLINGDPNCSGPVTSTISNASTWTPVVMGTAGGNTQPGNRALVGTDPEFHYAFGDGNARPTNPSDPTTAGAEHLVEAGMHFAGDGPVGTTGMYYDSGCGDEESPNASIPVLDGLTTTGPGNWTEDSFPPCGGSVQQIASVAEFSIVADSDIQNWGCSDHTTWPAFPADWNAEAVATDTASHPTCGTDPGTGTTACGEAYVLLAGKGVTATAPDISLSPTSATNPVGGSHTVTATVTQSGSPVSGATVTFAIASGPNAGASGTCTFSDNSADPGCTTGSDGEVLFTYSDTGGAGTDSIDASVTLSGSTEHATATKTWVAASDESIQAKGINVSGTEGAELKGTVATFTDPDTSATASEYSATIKWGDGAESAGTVSGSGGSFSVEGSHTYSDEGSYTVTVEITDIDNASNSATTTSMASVADAALTAGTLTVPPTTIEGNPTAASFTFTDGNTGATPADFTATIKWGDGNETMGTVTGGGGSFSVSGSHTYAKAGSYVVTVSVVDDGGSKTGASANTKVEPKCAAKPPKVAVRWHYSAEGSSGSWSVTREAMCGKTLTMGPQAMEGALKVTPGKIIKAGYDFTLPSNTKPWTAMFTEGKVVFKVRCVSGAKPSEPTFTVTLPDQSYFVTNAEWIPSGNQSSPLVYQGHREVPALCGKGQLSLAEGGTFSTFFTIH